MAALHVTVQLSVGVLFLTLPGRVLGGQGECQEPAVRNVCHCNRYAFMVGNQCNQCKDVHKWGRGCDMPCKEECKDGCTLIGDCIVPDHVNCKRDSRMDNNPHPKNTITNAFGECQHCKDGWHGAHCDSKCPINCEHSQAEGPCTRMGMCYSCKDGWWGDKCDQACPKGCPKCTMKDDPDDPDGWKGGSCPGDCEKDLWGSACEEQCPENCKKLVWGSSCAKDTGLCSQCFNHQFWGDKCEDECPKQCQFGQCNKETGHCSECENGLYWGSACEEKCPEGCERDACVKSNGECEHGCKANWWSLPKCEKECEKGCWEGACQADTGHCSHGCNDGKWSDFCNKTCPEKTVGSCEHRTGLPDKCEEGYYPHMKNLVPECKPCSELCKDGKCNQEGTCTDGCEPGGWGVDTGCMQTCPSNCKDGLCDPNTGSCYECNAGFTGSRCHKKCHQTCKTCLMQGNAVYANQCTSCFKDTEPVDLTLNGVLGVKGKAGTCNCIEQAAREDPDGSCACLLTEDAHDDLHIGWYRTKGNKHECDIKCIDKHSEVYVGKKSYCIPNSQTKWIYIQATDLKQGECTEEEYEIKTGTSGHFCMATKIVDAMVKE